MSIESKAYSFSDAKAVIRRRRNIKAVSHDTNLAGSRGLAFEEILELSDNVLSSMKITHREWIKTKLDSLSGYLKDHEIEPVFKKGLEITMTQEHRVLKKSINGTYDLQDPLYVQDIIAGYTFEFYQSLRISQRMGIDTKTALGIAQLSYRHNPNILLRLKHDPRYKSIPLSFRNRAALEHPKNPERFLDGILATIDRLRKTPKYKDLDQSILLRAAFGNPRNTEAFLDNFISILKNLAESSKYGVLIPSTRIKAALDHPKDPERFLDGIIATIDRLIGMPEYKDVNQSVLEYAALQYPSDPEIYLKRSHKTK